jgi:multiple sugar transport system ATP-binding protein
MAEIKLESVTKIYDNRVVAVSRVDLAVRHREFLVLVGPSGCGKTTILRMIAGLEEISSGSVFIDGRLVNQTHPKDRNVAMVFQNYALYPHMTVYDNISFGLRMVRTEKKLIAKKVGETAAMLGLSDYLDRKPKALSGGQRQRVALARAIVKSPKAFLFDEPLSNLDAHLRTQTRAELKKLQQQLETTAVYVTHDRVEAMTLGDRIAVMKAGKLQQVGEPLEIYHDPDNVFVANFIGSPGINLINGRLARARGGMVFEGGGLGIPLPGLKLRPEPGSPAVLGLRPEDLALTTPARGIRCSVDLVEQLGGESLVYASGEGGLKLVARTEGNVRLSRGANIGLAPDQKTALLFDPKTELRVR